jgi:endonuclease/exonuclease/phosphatase family metal-dependent hydrolase
MRIVSWNMGNNSVRNELHDAAWHHLLDEESGLHADVALVQEAVLPTWLEREHHAHWVRAWDTRSWGTGIVVKTSCCSLRTDMVAEPVEGGRFVVSSLDVDGREFVVASIHAQTSVPEFMPPLVATFDAMKMLCSARRFIVGGDLNTSRSSESFWPDHGHGPFWESLDAWGFVSCFWQEHGEEAVTYRHPTGPFHGQADHILIDRETASGAVVNSHVDAASTGLSDHQALVVDIVWRR